MSTDPRFTPVLLALPSFTPSLALEVLPHGVTLHRLFVQADGKTHDILIGPENPEDHLRQKYTNTIVGRYANRLPVPAPAADAAAPTPITLSKDGATAQFFPQANEKPTVSLHGGVTGFDFHVWEALPDIGAATLFTPAEAAFAAREFAPQSAAVFARTSPDGEEGFPGALRVETLVALVPPRGRAVDAATGAHCLGSVLLVYRAKLEADQGLTPVNLTQVRPPSRLRGVSAHARSTGASTSMRRSRTASRRSRGTRSACRCVLPSRSFLLLTARPQAAHTLALDPTTALATGALAPVAGTHHDHAAKATGTLGEAFDGGYGAPRPPLPGPR